MNIEHHLWSPCQIIYNTRCVHVYMNMPPPPQIKAVFPVTLAHPIFTVNGWFPLLLAAFDLALIFWALQVVIWLRKIDFWAFKNINQASVTQVPVGD